MQRCSLKNVTMTALIDHLRTGHLEKHEELNYQNFIHALCEFMCRSLLSHLSVVGLHEKRKKAEVSVCLCMCVQSRAICPFCCPRVPEQAVAEGRGQICVPQLFMTFPLHLFSVTAAHSARQSSSTTVARSKKTPLLAPRDGRMIPLSGLYNVCEYHLNVWLTLASDTGNCADS